MTLRGRIEILRPPDIGAASVGQILNSLRTAGRRHALMGGSAGTGGEPEICGICFAKPHP
jgi:hypothetical protein